MPWKRARTPMPALACGRSVRLGPEVIWTVLQALIMLYNHLLDFVASFEALEMDLQ